MLLYGASGHGKVICSALEQLKEPIMGIFDDNSSASYLNNYQILGPYNNCLFGEDSLIISIGDNKIRQILAKKVKHRFGICISKFSFCDKTVRLGHGAVILHGSVVQRDVNIGSHVIINTSSSIDHDCFISDYAHISPGVTLCGAVQIGEGTHIGAGATVIQNIKIGKWCIIGAGSVIIEDIPDYSIVVGVPGKVIKKIVVNE